MDGCLPAQGEEEKEGKTFVTHFQLYKVSSTGREEGPIRQHSWARGLWSQAHWIEELGT